MTVHGKTFSVAVSFNNECQLFVIKHSKTTKAFPLQYIADANIILTNENVYNTNHILRKMKSPKFNFYKKYFLLRNTASVILYFKQRQLCYILSYFFTLVLAVYRNFVDG